MIGNFMAEIQTSHFPNTNHKDYYLRQPVHRMVSYCKEKQTEDNQNNMIMRIFGPKKQDVTGGLRKLHIECMKT